MARAEVNLLSGVVLLNAGVVSCSALGTGRTLPSDTVAEEYRVSTCRVNHADIMERVWLLNENAELVYWYMLKQGPLQAGWRAC